MACCFDWIAPVYDIVMPRRRPDEFLSLLEPARHDSVLEIGAGTGRIARHYAPNVADCVLLDPSHRMLDRARRKVPRARHVLGRAERMQFADGCFDKVVSFDSLHHWQDQARGLEEVYRVLKPEGRFFVVEVNPHTFGGWRVQTLETLLRMRSRFHPPDRLVEMLRRAGLRDVAQASVGDGFTYGVVATR